MPETTDFGLTYPDNTGHTRLWEHFQALAEDAEAAFHGLAGAWQACALAANVNGWAKIRREGPALDILRLEMALGRTSGNFTHGTHSLTLPVGFRPVINRVMVCGSATGATTNGVHTSQLSIVAADGTCFAQNVPASCVTLRINTTFSADDLSA